ncbi:ABC transporter ATP-binding protein [Mesorhizobium sp. M4A.F.Ca.ET.020.02.1.1]|uniref:ABC transporter ATP-binding protein n=1 Tax=unclassified Mesorhizobium TaxID=325217 RepID=UPI000FD57319|nr:MULTISPECIES: ABC transporter ATP-binding protein [unclassified Mesorhizobium]RVD32207.1 ABC transporter ATP-binding protein [Mesorhizobium sp. M4A.F.Ca.ET.020.02.1.1]RWC10060.1 MAG: ABC transporter ATP-binding protein [Mesorhizobium sp.]
MGELALQSVDLSFGGLKALRGVSLALGGRGVIGLIGPNGAGKTTCINVLTGMIAPTAGDVTLDGQSLLGLAPSELRRRGISRTFQAGRLFSTLTVHENVAAAAVGLGCSRGQADKAADATLDWIGNAALGDRRASTLSYADQRRTAIARAIVEKPAFLLLDEPAAGMSQQEAIELGALIRRIHEELGVAVLLVEHNITLVFSVCDHIHVLDSGAEIAVGPPDAIRASTAVREAYLGTSLERQEAARAEVAA